MLIEKYKVIQAFEPKTTNAAIKSAYVDLKNTITVAVVVNLAQAVAHETEISLYQAKDIKGTDEKPLENKVPILANEDVSKSDGLERKADGVSYKVEKIAENKQIIFRVDPAKLDVNNGFCCLGLKIEESAQATNFASAEFVLKSKYSN